jgi:hypothetical protein
MDESTLLEPIASYPSYKENVRKEADAYFENLLKKSGCDYAENQRLCADYYRKQAEYEALLKKAESSRTLKTALIVLSVVFFAVGILFLLNGIPASVLWAIIAGSVLLVLGAGMILFVVFKVNKTLKERDNKKDEAEKKAAEALRKVEESSAALNGEFDWGMDSDIFNKSVPVLRFDKKLDDRKYEMLRKHYGMEGNTDPDISIVGVRSGSILGNPFILLRQYIHSTVDETYEGHLTIHWTTTSTDSEGHTHVQNHTETLTATTVHPAPAYHYETYLVYGNDAAEKLRFSRFPTVDPTLDEKQLAKRVRQDEKKMSKLAEKELMDNDSSTNFTAMANTEFESLFHAWNRNDETQFRLLFTPLAQKNMTALLKSKEPYGDDFAFVKEGKLNYIESDHSQNADSLPSPGAFYGFDIKKMKEHFLAVMEEIFQGMYFDLAPLLSVPLYQMTKTRDYIYHRDPSESNVSEYEQEAMANTFSKEALQAKGTITPLIVKTSYEGKTGGNDHVMITAHSFRGIARTDYVSVMGGDGYMHSVPVHWTEYIAVRKDTPMEVRNFDSTYPLYRKLSANQGFRNFLSRYAGAEYSYRSKTFAYLSKSPSDGTEVVELEQELSPFVEKRDEGNP